MSSDHDGFSGCDEPNMEIRIDTLMGTSIDMRVSATDTVRDIKQRIYRVEGIPVHQLNLIHQSQELNDCRRLCDLGIQNGAVLKLVAAMKGGPISTRRLATSTCDHHVMLKELKELLENTRDEIGDKLAPGSKVSVLVFKEGDILNLLRVIENEDGSYSPYSEKPAISPPIRPRNKDSQLAIFKKFVEDTEMMAKISTLRKRMDELHLKKQTRNTTTTTTISRSRTSEDNSQEHSQPSCSTQPSSSCNSSHLSYKLLSDCMESVDLKIFENNAAVRDDIDNDDEDEDTEEEIALKDKHRLKPIPKSIYGESKGAYSHTKQSYLQNHVKKPCMPRSTVHVTRLVLSSDALDTTPKTPDGIELEESAVSGDDVWEMQDVPAADHRVKHHHSSGSGTRTTCKFGFLKRRPSATTVNYDSAATSKDFDVSNFFQVAAAAAAASSSSSGYYRAPLYNRKSTKQLTEDDCSRIERLRNDCKTMKEEVEKMAAAAAAINTERLYDSGEELEEEVDYEGGQAKEAEETVVKLGPVLKKRSRCSECNKRLNITNIYDCRCGKIFCAVHRYSEVHGCKHDYKTEGKRILEHQNPLVTAEKINRI